MRARRDNARVQAGLSRLKDDCKGSGNILPAVLECVRAYATVGEISDVWREAFGEYTPEAMRF